MQPFSAGGQQVELDHHSGPVSLLCTPSKGPASFGLLRAPLEGGLYTEWALLMGSVP